MPQTAVACALGAWAAAVAWSDIRRRRVPNALLLLMLVPAVLALAVNGRGLLGAAPLSSVLGLLAAAVLLPGYAMGQMGAGDVKFAGCIGLALGGWGAVEMLLVGLALLGAMSAFVRWRGGEATAKLRLPATPAFTAAFGVQLLLGRLLPLGV